MIISQPYNEKELLTRLSAGDVHAYDILFRRYWDHVYSAGLLASRSNAFAEDIAQEVFLWLWKERERITSIENLKAYLYTATRNGILRKLKRLDIEERYRLTAGSRILQVSPADPELSLQYKELKEQLENGIRQMPPQQQRAFRLSREKGLSHEDIALQMGLSPNTVKDYIVKSIAFLRKHLAQQGDETFFLLLALFL